MKLKLKRKIISNRAILGTLFNEKNQEICKTLENPYLNNHRNISSIPCGCYKVVSYSSPKYPNVWEIIEVKNRSKILIHQGNFEEDTQGCVLVGKKWSFINGKIAVSSSRLTLEKLQNELPNSFLLEIS